MKSLITVIALTAIFYMGAQTLFTAKKNSAPVVMAAMLADLR